MHLSLRLAFARTDCTPMTHCVPMGRNSCGFRVFIWWTVQDSNPSVGFRVLFFRILPFFFVFTQPAFVPPAAVQVLALPLT